MSLKTYHDGCTEHVVDHLDVMGHKHAEINGGPCPLHLSPHQIEIRKSLLKQKRQRITDIIEAQGEQGWTLARALQMHAIDQEIDTIKAELERSTLPKMTATGETQ